MFTRQHYKHVAQRLRTIEDAEQRSYTACFLANMFHDDNVLFSREAFLTATCSRPDSQPDDEV